MHSPRRCHAAWSIDGIVWIRVGACVLVWIDRMLGFRRLPSRMECLQQNLEWPTRYLHGILRDEGTEGVDENEIRAGATPAPKGKRVEYMGTKLSSREISQSFQHAPTDAHGKTICWDANTHHGCSYGFDCKHSHDVLQPNDFHWTVQAHLIRRGGHKRSRAIP